MVEQQNGGGETERGPESVYFQRLILILATLDMFWMLKVCLSLC